MEHLVYVDKKAKELEKLITGDKTMIIRGAAGKKLPFGRVFANEWLYFVQNDGKKEVEYCAKVKEVKEYVKLSNEESSTIVEQYHDELQLSDAQIKRWSGKKCLCIVQICDFQKIEKFTFERASNMDDWIMAEDVRQLDGVRGLY